MKAIFKFLPLSFLFLTSCVKEYSFEKGEQFYLNYKADGVPKSAVIFGAGDYTDPGNGDLEIYGATDSVANSGTYVFSFEINSNTKKVVVGEYTDTDPDFKMYAVYTDSTIPLNYLAGYTLLQLAASDGVTVNNHFKVNVLELKDYNVRGTFSGDFYENGDPKGRMIKITDGEFYIRMRQ